VEFKKIKGKEHRLYDNMAEFMAFNESLAVSGDWRHGDQGDWVYTDDDFICKVLGKSKLKHPGYKELRTVVRTVCGSFIVEQKTHRMLGDNGVAENIYAFSGNYDSIYDRQSNRKLNNREFLFARFIAAGDDVIDSYKKAYPKAKDMNYIKKKSNILLNKEKVRTMIKDEIKKILADEGISPEWIVAKYKDIADLSDRDTDRLRSLEALAKMAGLFDTEKKQEQLTVFTGFTPEQMEAISGGAKTKLVAHKGKEDES